MFDNKSYELHIKHIGKQTDDKLKIWRDEDTTDAYVHNEVYNLLNPIVKACPSADWLTLGDGRGGTDAHALKIRGAKAHASDLTTQHLEKAVEAGFIDECSAQNAENITFADEYFDFVLCKESYHHFPKPMIAVYEMLRVSKCGVVIIEPCDSEIFTPDELTWRSGMHWFWQGIKNSIKKIINKPIYYEF
jgi:ubiquinone/menaquinone biosynthesis C-methylase UbiE